MGKTESEQKVFKIWSKKPENRAKKSNGKKNLSRRKDLTTGQRYSCLEKISSFLKIEEKGFPYFLTLRSRHPRRKKAEGKERETSFSSPQWKRKSQSGEKRLDLVLLQWREEKTLISLRGGGREKLVIIKASEKGAPAVKGGASGKKNWGKGFVGRFGKVFGQMRKTHQKGERRSRSPAD